MHHLALVLVPADTEDVDAAVEQLMEPWQETETTTGWDWYQIDGRWGHANPSRALVRDVPELRPYTVVADGVLAHREQWIGPDLDNGEWVEDDRWSETAGRILLAHRDHKAVVVDWHA